LTNSPYLIGFFRPFGLLQLKLPLFLCWLLCVCSCNGKIWMRTSRVVNLTNL
jgi:hypothetical protein